MPIYDYACSVCGRVTEVIHGIHAEGPRFCPACGAEGSMRKAVSSPSIVFKGSGWAKLDRRGSSGSGSSGKSRAAGGGTKGDSGKSDGSRSGAGSGAGSGEGSGSSSAPSAPASSSGSED